jgi:hypothetical protein
MREMTYAACGPRSQAADATAHIEKLRGYLTERYATQSLFNRVWLLLAATRWKDLLTKAQRDALIAEVQRAQQDDGGWSLRALGGWRWSKAPGRSQPPGTLDGTLLAKSDGHATGLIVYTLRKAGFPGNDPAVSRGVHWLKANQQGVQVGGPTEGSGARAGRRRSPARESPGVPLFAHCSWPVLWPATATVRHPRAKARNHGREAENEKRGTEAREARRPRVAVNGPKDDAAASQHGGQWNRKRKRPPHCAARGRPLPSQGGRRIRVAIRGATVYASDWAHVYGHSPPPPEHVHGRFQALARRQAFRLGTLWEPNDCRTF